MVALHDLYWNFLFSHQMICKQDIILNHMFFQYESNLKPITYSPFWLNIFHDVSKLTIIQHTHTAQLYFTDIFSLFDQCYESQWKRVGTNMPISPTEPMLKISLFFLPFQSESTIPDQIHFFEFQNCHLVSLIVLVPQWMLNWRKWSVLGQ